MEIKLTKQGSKAYFIEKSVMAVVLIPTIVGCVYYLIKIIQRYLEIKTTKYEFKDSALLSTFGIFSTSQGNLSLWRINDFELRQSFFEKLFKNCSVIIASQDRSSQNFVMYGLELEQGKAIMEFLQQNIDKARRENRVSNISF